MGQRTDSKHDTSSFCNLQMWRQTSTINATFHSLMLLKATALCSSKGCLTERLITVIESIKLMHDNSKPYRGQNGEKWLLYSTTCQI